MFVTRRSRIMMSRCSSCWNYPTVCSWLRTLGLTCEQSVSHRHPEALSNLIDRGGSAFEFEGEHGKVEVTIGRRAAPVLSEGEVVSG